MDHSLVNANGKILKAAEATVPLLDRGFLYGDSLYEVARSYNGVLFHLDSHLERLQSSGKLAHFKISQNRDLLKSEILKTVAQFRAQPQCASEEVYCRIMITRGVVSTLSFAASNVGPGTQYYILVQPVSLYSQGNTPEKFEKGLKFQIVARQRLPKEALDPALKSGNYLNCVLALIEAQSAGFDDALLCNAQDQITEATTSNIFYIKDATLFTPPLDIGILEGITRKIILRLAQTLGLKVSETRFSKNEIYQADEVFISGSVKEVFPVTQIDTITIGASSPSPGKPGPWTRKLAQAYRAEIQSQS